jgi:hypothetical protein
MKKLVEKVMETKEQGMVVEAKDMNKSEKIKALFEGGLEVKQISLLLGIRYNHAYNVIQNHVIVNGIEVIKSERAGSPKKAEVVAILENGGKLIDAAKMTKSSYNYVWKVSQELKNKDLDKDFDEMFEQELKILEEQKNNPAIQDAIEEHKKSLKKGKKGV